MTIIWNEAVSKNFVCVCVFRDRFKKLFFQVRLFLDFFLEDLHFFHLYSKKIRGLTLFKKF